jgi:hypothetical protein
MMIYVKEPLVFEFGKLKEMLNKILLGSVIVLSNGVGCENNFCINYGEVEYIDRVSYRANTVNLPNSVVYLHYKDAECYKRDQELRITLLSFQRLSYYGKELLFDNAFHLGFNFKEALANGVIRKIEYSHNCDLKYLVEEFKKL